MIMKAVSTASESNAWEDYIFDPITNDSSLLHHVMVSIEDCTGAATESDKTQIVVPVI